MLKTTDCGYSIEPPHLANIRDMSQLFNMKTRSDIAINPISSGNLDYILVEFVS